ncbi:uncharacterized protein ACBT57_023905 isoform 2-T2 [Dama dama]
MQRKARSCVCGSSDSSNQGMLHLLSSSNTTDVCTLEGLPEFLTFVSMSFVLSPIQGIRNRNVAEIKRQEVYIYAEFWSVLVQRGVARLKVLTAIVQRFERRFLLKCYVAMTPGFT